MTDDEDREMIENSIFISGKQEGIKEGIEKGTRQGAKEKEINIIKNMKKKYSYRNNTKNNWIKC